MVSSRDRCVDRGRTDGTPKPMGSPIQRSTVKTAVNTVTLGPIRTTSPAETTSTGHGKRNPEGPMTTTLLGERRVPVSEIRLLGQWQRPGNWGRPNIKAGDVIIRPHWSSESKSA